MKFNIINPLSETLEDALGISPKTAEILNAKAKGLIEAHVHEPEKVISILSEIDLPVNEFAYFNQAMGAALMTDAILHRVKLVL